MQADAELLAAYRATGNEAAFAEIHARHGALVLRTCLRALGDMQEAEDAAQAAFLMLAQRPTAVQGSLASWLYYAARKTAFVARRSRKRRSLREETAAIMQPAMSLPENRELREEIDAALERLPDPLREAVLLCHLEGREQQEAARQAGCSQATMSRRSSEGLQQLGEVLRRRGLPLGAVGLTAWLATEAAVAAPLPPLTAAQLAASPQAASLAQAAWRTLFWSQVKIKVAAGLLTVLLMAATIGLLWAWREPGPRSLRVPVLEFARRQPAALDEPPLARARAVLDHSDRVICVAFSPDGKSLASAGADRRIQIHDVQTHQLLATLTGHRGALKCVVFSPDGLTLASSDVLGVVMLWDVRSQQVRQTLKGLGSIASVAFSPDGDTLALGASKGEVQLWNLRTGSQQATLRGHTRSVYCLAFSSDGRTLASGSGDRTVRLWDVATRRERFCLSNHPKPIGAVAFSPDGHMLAAGSGRSLEEIWGPATVVPEPTGSPKSGAITLWNADTGKSQGTFRTETAGIYSLAFSPNGQLLALGSGDALVKLWKLPHEREAVTLRGHAALVRSLVFSPDGKTLASASHDLTVRLWDVAPATKTGNGGNGR